jgi:hypothetical protein
MTRLESRESAKSASPITIARTIKQWRAGFRYVKGLRSNRKVVEVGRCNVLQGIASAEEGV